MNAITFYTGKKGGEVKSIDDLTNKVHEIVTKYGGTFHNEDRIHHLQQGFQRCYHMPDGALIYYVASGKREIAPLPVSNLSGKVDGLVTFVGFKKSPEYASMFDEFLLLWKSSSEK